MTLATELAECLRRYGLAQTAGVVAVSGGPDSVALAHLCLGLLREGSIRRLIFAHVNHQLRGDESDADEAFVSGFLTRPGGSGEPSHELTVRTVKIDVAAIARSEHDNLEGVARRERYRWFGEVARAENADWVATGHTADDQAETVLFRLMRGSGVLGLAGIAPCRPLAEGVKLIRPLLGVRRQALVDYLEQHHIASRVDSSNRDPRFTRNRIRLELLPQLTREYNPGIVEVLCRLAVQAEELRTDITRDAGELLRQAELPKAGAIVVLSVDRLREASANLLREMFRLIWQREGWPMGAMDFDHWRRLIDITLGSGAAGDFPGRIRVRRLGGVAQLGPMRLH